ncbi:MAG TPA: hypothetical protein PK847_15845 [Candidatus Sumerlaeota bacterium]|nr:hypothetical protein [Candidatus Sumerlaeota bacterium]
MAGTLDRPPPPPAESPVSDLPIMENPEWRPAPLREPTHGMRRMRPDATFRTLFGLVVIWGVLVMVFVANRLSDNFLEVEPRLSQSINTDQVLMRRLDPAQKLPLPLTMYMRNVSAQQAMQLVSNYVGFEMDPDDLTLLDEEPRTISFDEIPLYQAIHQLIDNPGLGVSMMGRQLNLFHQRIELEGDADSGSVNWQARLPLSEARQLIVPSGQLNLWFMIRLEGPPANGQGEWREVLVELWRGSDLLSLTRAPLDAQGRAQLELSASDSLVFMVKRISERAAAAPGEYELAFYYLYDAEPAPAAAD